MSTSTENNSSTRELLNCPADRIGLLGMILFEPLLTDEEGTFRDENWPLLSPFFNDHLTGLSEQFLDYWTRNIAHAVMSAPADESEEAFRIAAQTVTNVLFDVLTRCVAAGADEKWAESVFERTQASYQTMPGFEWFVLRTLREKWAGALAGLGQAT